MIKIDIADLLNSNAIPSPVELEKSLSKKVFKQASGLSYREAAALLEANGGDKTGYGVTALYPIFVYYALAANSGDKDAYNDIIRVAKKYIFGRDVDDPRLHNIIDICLEKKKQLKGFEKDEEGSLTQNIVQQDLDHLFKQLNSFEDRVLAERLDIAFEIYEHCNASLNKNLTKELIAEIIAAQKNALKFLLMTLNIEDEGDILPLMHARQRVKLYRSDYIPRKYARKLASLPQRNLFANHARQNWHKLVTLSRAHQPAKMLTMRAEKYQTDIENSTIMLTPLERDAHRVVIKDGDFFQRTHDNDYREFDSITRRSHGKEEYIAYTINPERELSVFDHFEIADGYAHSSMNAQGRIMVSGELRVEKGKLTHLTVYSMHYRPQEENVYEALKFFKDEGVNLSKVTVRLWDEKNPHHEKKFIDANAQEFFDFHEQVERENEKVQVILHPEEGYREYIHPTQGSSYEIIPEGELKVSAATVGMFAMPHQVFDFPKRSFLEERPDLVEKANTLRSQ